MKKLFLAIFICLFSLLSLAQADDITKTGEANTINNVNDNAKAAANVDNVIKTPKYIFDSVSGQYKDTTTEAVVPASNLPWPPNGGFTSSSRQTIETGIIVDRYGSPSGRYAGQPGATVSERGMPQGSETKPYTKYRVVKPVEAEVGPAAPVQDFGAIGGATQYMFDKSIEQLVKDGILEEVRNE